jgi:hypothetical protein
MSAFILRVLENKNVGVVGAFLHVDIVVTKPHVYAVTQCF